MRLESLALTQTFKLETDPDGVAEVTIRQASEGENIERAQMYAKTRWVNTGVIGENAAEQEINPRRLRRKEVYLTLASASGFTYENAKGKEVELFKSGDTKTGPRVSAAMSEVEFNEAWDRLPTDVAQEIGRLVLKVNPDWDPESEGE